MVALGQGYWRTMVGQGKIELEAGLSMPEQPVLESVAIDPTYKIGHIRERKHFCDMNLDKIRCKVGHAEEWIRGRMLSLFNLGAIFVCCYDVAGLVGSDLGAFMASREKLIFILLYL